MSVLRSPVANKSCLALVCTALLIGWVSSRAVISGGLPPQGAYAALTATQAKLAEQLQRAFEHGFVVGPKRLQEAQKSLAEARKISPGDPRVYYATGLVLIKQSQLSQALVQFQAAIDHDPDYWPAWQGAAWAQLVDKRYDAGLGTLLEFCLTVRKAAPDEEPTEAQRDAARWVGQVLVALSLADDARRHEKLLDSRGNEILDALGENLWDALEEGRDLVKEREFARSQAAGLARQAAEATEKARRERKAAKLEKNLDDAAKAKDDNERTQEGWKTWLDEELAKSDKLLERLEKDYGYLDQRAQTLMQSISVANQELMAMEITLGGGNLRNVNPMALQNAQQQYVQRQNQLVAYQLDYNITLGRLADVSQNGAQAWQQRGELVARYEKATGDLSRKNSGLDKWSERLTTERQKLAVHKPAKGGKGGPADKAADKPEKKPAALTFKSILPLDLQHEKERLLTSLAPTENPADEQD